MSQSQAWKDWERRVCRDLGLTRRGQVTAGGYAKGSDNDDTGPFAVECKYLTRYQLRHEWIEQARADGRPWGLFLMEHRDRTRLVVQDYDEWLILYRAAFAPLGAAKPGFGTPATTNNRSI